MVEYDSTHDGYVHPDYPDRLFHALTEPPSMTNQETMVEQSFMPLPNEVDDDVFATAVRAAIDNHPHLNPDDDVDAVNYFERLYDESHTYRRCNYIRRAVHPVRHHDRGESYVWHAVRASVRCTTAP